MCPQHISKYLTRCLILQDLSLSDPLKRLCFNTASVKSPGIWEGLGQLLATKNQYDWQALLQHTSDLQAHQFGFRDHQIRKRKEKSPQTLKSNVQTYEILVNSNITAYRSLDHSHEVWANLSVSPSSSACPASLLLRAYFPLSLPGVILALEMSLWATAYSTFTVKYSL